MLLTFAEIQFLVSLCGDDPALPTLDLLDLLDEPSRNEDDIEAAGLASLVARELCREYLDDEGYVQHVELDHEIADIHEAMQAAVTTVRITTVSPERSTFWLLLVGAAADGAHAGGRGGVRRGRGASRRRSASAGRVAGEQCAGGRSGAPVWRSHVAAVSMRCRSAPTTSWVGRRPTRRRVCS